jgi:hypothetical protein
MSPPPESRLRASTQSVINAVPSTSSNAVPSRSRHASMTTTGQSI